jgi:holo-[acyl-carrier protein] synthase
LYVMDVICHGIDLVDCNRIQELLTRHGQRFLDRVFTPTEQEYSQRHRLQVERLSGRFAVKEAVMKMLGTGWQNGIAWTDIEVINDALGRPEVKLSGKVAAVAKELGIEQVSVSITHTSGLAVASAIALGNK